MAEVGSCPELRGRTAPVTFAIAVPQLVGDGEFDGPGLRTYLARAELRTIAEAGADLLVLHPLVDEAEQMERLAADVIPLVA